jgi:RHS repeat-associated protein
MKKVLFVLCLIFGSTFSFAITTTISNTLGYSQNSPYPVIPINDGCEIYHVTSWSTDDNNTFNAYLSGEYLFGGSSDYEGLHTRVLSRTVKAESISVGEPPVKYWKSGSGTINTVLFVDIGYKHSSQYAGYSFNYGGGCHLKIINNNDDPPHCPSVGNPVDPMTGYKWERAEDIPSYGYKNSLHFERYYKQGLNRMAIGSVSRPDNWRNSLGAGWTHNFNINIQKAGNSDTLVFLYNGVNTEVKKFHKAAGDSLYKSQNGDSRYLKKTGDHWLLYLGTGSRWHFNSFGQIDTIYENDEKLITFEYNATDTTLTRVKDIQNNSLELRYNSGKLAKVFNSADSANYYEYRYYSSDTVKSLYQVLSHTNVTTSDSLKVTGRYYYDAPGLYGILNTKTMPKGSQALDTNWATSRNKEDRLNCWYKNTSDTTGINRGNPAVYEELVSDSASGNKVLYRAYFRFFFNTTTLRQYPDSTKAYYYEDSTAANAHNPIDTLFAPADSLPTAFGTKYYIYTIAYDTTGTKKFVWEYCPATGDSARTTYSGYDRNYNPGSVTDPNSGVTYYTYQAYKNPGDTATRYWPSPKVVKYPNGDSVITFFSAKGDSNYRLPDSTKDEAGKRTWHYYDASNDYVDTATVYKVRVLADGEGSSHDVTQRYHYNSKGNLTETIDPLGHKTIMHYTNSDTGLYLTEQRIVMSTDTGATDIVTNYGYNMTLGTLDTMTFYRDYPNNPSKTYYTYDVNKRLVKTVYPDTAKDSMVYDLRGNLLKKYTIKTDTLYKAVYEYDPHDHITKLKEYRSPNDSANACDSTLYAYNLHDRMISQTNALGKTTNYTYCMDRLVKVAYPDTTFDSLGYWAGGDLKFKLDRKGQVTYYQYDGYSSGCGCMSSSRSRLARKNYYDSLDQYEDSYGFANPSDTVLYEYDKAGNRTKMVDKNGTTVYSYDDMNRLWSDSSGYLNTKNRYQYDMAGNRTRMKVYQGDDTTVCHLDQQYKHYDNANRVDTVTVSSEDYVFDYWDTGTPKQVQYPNGAKEVYGLNLRGSIDSIATTLGDTLTWFKNKYGYNGLGDRTWQYLKLTCNDADTLNDTIKYHYDGLRRLSRVDYPATINSGDIITYTYDALGNRLTKYSVMGSTEDYEHNTANNQMTRRYVSGYYDYGYKYDANGNLDTINSSNHYLQYDYENRITQYKWGVKRNYDFYYNGDGVRMQKACGANTGETSIKYAHDGMNAVLEFDNDMNLQYKYIYVNGMLMGRVDASDQESYYHHDGLGSTIGMTDATPAVAKSYLYDEFGTAIGIWGDAVNTYKYTGQEAEGGPNDGYNLRAREYYTCLGRFMQNDPIGDRGGSLNWFTYVGNNPVNDKDLTGLECCNNDIPELQRIITTQKYQLCVIHSWEQGFYSSVEEAYKYMGQGTGSELAITNCRGYTPTTTYYNNSDKNICYGKCVIIHETVHQEWCTMYGIRGMGLKGEKAAILASLPCLINCLRQTK